MEAVPRLPMLSFDLKHSPEYVEFAPALKQYIQEQYGEDPAHYNKACTEIEQLRQSSVHVSRDFIGCTTLKKYYAQLQFLQGRFQLSEGGEHGIVFTWEDIQTGREHVISDIKFEQACILYNIGSLHSILGAIDTRQNAEGMKVSCTHFQCAAWAYEHLRDHFGSSAMSTDMAHEMLTFQINLMLAQAQECILEKSMIDSRKNTITAKVAAQVVEFYKLAIKNLDICNTEGLVNSRCYKDWKKRMELKISLYQCIMYYYTGKESEEKSKWGETLAYFTASQDKLTDSIKAAKNEVPEIQDALKFAQDVVGGKYTSAQKDNDFVYHDKVPTLDSLPEIKGASLVKGIPFNPNDTDISGPDIFQKLVPMEAHEASSVYSEEKAKLLRLVASQVEERNLELDQFLSSIQIDKNQLNPPTDRLPEDLLEKCAALSVRTHAIQDLIDQMSAVSGVSTDVDLNIKEILELLEEEGKKEEDFQKTFGNRTNNIILSEIRKETDSCQIKHRQGSLSNENLHTAMNTHITNLRLLAGPPEQLLTSLPSLQPDKTPEDEGVIEELKKLLNKIDEMKSQRTMLHDQLHDQIQSDDITNVLVTQDGANKETIFSEQLKKHDKLKTLLEQNMMAQNNILQALTDCNAKYATIRQATAETVVRRESRVKELINSFNVYEDLMAKSQKGLDYYKKLEETVVRLVQRCRGVCKVQQEERDQISSRFAAKAPPSRPSAPKPAMAIPSSPQPTFTAPPSFDGSKLKDYLPFMKPATFGPKSKNPSTTPNPNLGPDPNLDDINYSMTYADLQNVGVDPRLSAYKPVPPMNSSSMSRPGPDVTFQGQRIPPDVAAQAYKNEIKSYTDPSTLPRSSAQLPMSSGALNQPNMSYQMGGIPYNPAMSQPSVYRQDSTSTVSSVETPVISPTNESQHMHHGVPQQPHQQGQQTPRGNMPNIQGPHSIPTSGIHSQQYIPQGPQGRVNPTDSYIPPQGNLSHSFQQMPSQQQFNQAPQLQNTRFVQPAVNSQHSPRASPGPGVPSSANMPYQTPQQPLNYQHLPQTNLQSFQHPTSQLPPGQNTGTQNWQHPLPVSSSAPKSIPPVPPNQSGQNYGQNLQGQMQSQHFSPSHQINNPPNVSQSLPPGSQLNYYNYSSGQIASTQQPQNVSYQPQTFQNPQAFPHASNQQSVNPQQNSAQYYQNTGQGFHGQYHQIQPGIQQTLPGQQSASPGHQQQVLPLQSQQQIRPALQQQLPPSSQQHNQPGSFQQLLPQAQQQMQPGHQQLLPQNQQHLQPGLQQHLPSQCQQQMPISQIHPGSQQQLPPPNQQLLPQNQIQPGSQQQLPAQNQPQPMVHSPQIQPGMRQQLQSPQQKQIQPGVPSPIQTGQQLPYSQQQQMQPRQQWVQPQHMISQQQVRGTFRQASPVPPSQGYHQPNQFNPSVSGSQMTAARPEHPQSAAALQYSQVPAGNITTNRMPFTSQGGGTPASQGQYSNQSIRQAYPPTSQYQTSLGQTTPSQPYQVPPTQQPKYQPNAFATVPQNQSVQPQQFGGAASVAQHRNVPQPGTQFSQGPRMPHPTTSGTVLPVNLQQPLQPQSPVSHTPINTPTQTTTVPLSDVRHTEISKFSSLPTESMSSHSSPQINVAAGGHAPSLARQSSSLDEILSSTPDSVKQAAIPDPVIAPKVLTAQEKQQQKEEAMKNRGVPESRDPYSHSAALNKLVMDVERFGKSVDELSSSNASAYSHVDNIWRELMELQEQESKKQSIAIARCYPMKNRDQDIMPYDATRVLLSTVKDDFINASWINDLAPSCPKFITTQTPLPVTTTDFWVMVYEQGTEVVVMITSEYETGKKYPIYWPSEKGKAMEHGQIILNLQSVKYKGLWTERIIYMLHTETKQARTIVHLLYKNWPVSGFPDDVSHVVKFINETHTFYKQQRSLMKPIIVHCGNGIGRSGTFILIYTGMQELFHGNGMIDIPVLTKRVLSKRKNCVQNSEQLRFAYEALLYFAEDFLKRRNILVKHPHYSKQKPKPPTTHSSADDIVLGSVNLQTIQQNVGRLGEKHDTNTVQGQTTALASPSKGDNLSSLPDLIQQQSLTDNVIGGSSNSLVNNENILQDGGSSSPQNRSRSGSNSSILSSGSFSSANSKSSPQHLCKSDNKSSLLADLQNPNTFTLDSNDKRKKRITKASFSTTKKTSIKDNLDTSDPLSSLDPLWNLAKEKK